MMVTCVLTPAVTIDPRSCPASPAPNPFAELGACPGEANTTAVLAAKGGRVALYVDMHAHATKRGCFIYGNSLGGLTDQVENQLFAQLLAVNSNHFEYAACNFSRAHMEQVDKNDKDGLSSEGSGRVGMHAATGLTHSYTLECNYNTGKATNHVPAAQVSDAARALSIPPGC